MNFSCLTALILTLFISLNNVRAASPKVEKSNVIWKSPSKNSSGSMPLGNGDIGLNVWVEQNGDLLFFISKSDSWSDCDRLLKLGQVRVRLTPALPTQQFRQELELQNGQITIQGKSNGSVTKLRVWVDANHPIIHVEGTSKEVVSAEVSLNVWRNSEVDQQHNNSANGVISGGIPIIETADQVVPQKENSIIWYHRNSISIFPLTMKAQGLESLMGTTKDPLLNRTFGGLIYGDGFVKSDPWQATQALQTVIPTKHFEAKIAILTEQTETSEEWITKINRLKSEEQNRDSNQSWALHASWWKEFWQRSWISVVTPEDRMPSTPEIEAARHDERDQLALMGTKNWNNRADRDLTISGAPAGKVVSDGYAQQRFITAAAGRGAFPIRFNGSLFTVNTRDPNNLIEADYRSHGPLYWWQNTRLPYWPMLRSGDFDMMQPLFAMYRNVVPLAEKRTELYYKHEGVFFPETMYHWGTYSNDDYSSSRNWDRGNRPVALLQSMYMRYYWSGGLELMAMVLDYYDETQDPEFLKNTLLPMASGIAKFYDVHWKRDSQGKIRFDPACALEASHEVVNPLPEIAGLKFMLPRLIGLPQNSTTAEQRASWAKTLADLPEVPIGVENGKKILLEAEIVKDRPGDEYPELYGIFPYRLYTVGTPDLKIGEATFEKFVPVKLQHVYPYDGLIGAWRQSSIQAAYVGKTDQASRMVVTNFSAHHRGSRFPAFWGPGHDYMPDQCHGGVSMMTLQTMLLQVDGKKLFLFPAWPKDWDVDFKLHAPFKTTIEGRLKGGKLTLLNVLPASRKQDIINLLNKDI
ncbi:MAG: DUF5703 domain-containing protein [Bacteroidia bacterium]|nr:DUF5703 domain-containing protein [Bacteroidia bacterium]